MKIAYIAHPVGGDVKGNIEKIISIVKQINIDEPDTVPFVPYLADLFALDDNIPEHRERGIKNDHALIQAGFIHEVRLYGNRISNGMKDEIIEFQKLELPVIPMTNETMFQFMNKSYL